MGTGRDLMALRKDGREIPVEISLSFTRYNKKLLVMAFISDISQRKKAQEALRRSEEQLIMYAAELEKKVQMRTEALNNMVGELEKEVLERKRAVEETRKSLEKERELNELKSKFVSLASHEFRTPLSAIMSSASLINQYKEKGEWEKVDKHVTRIKSSVGHLTNILNDFLSLGKLEEGKVDVNPEPINLDNFFQEIEEELRPTLKAGQKIKLECHLEINSIISDSRILRNVLFNLISNASKYSGEHKNIYIRCQSGDGEVSFSITDEGIGIPEHDVKHIFERFFRATNANNIQGTGLGLNIVKRYAELLDGYVTFTSQFGVGSTFTITLPIKQS
jgi:signal transduction histidine kinase